MSVTDEASLTALRIRGVAYLCEGSHKETEVIGRLWRLNYDPANESRWPIPPIKLFQQGRLKELSVVQIAPVEVLFSRYTESSPGEYTKVVRVVVEDGKKEVT